MKKIMILPAIVATIGLAGCGPGPGDVVLEMQSAVCDTGKIAVMSEYATPKSQESIKTMSAMMDDPKKGKKFKKEMDKNCNSDDEIVEEIINGDSATVVFASGERQRLKRINDEWKVIVTK